MVNPVKLFSREALDKMRSPEKLDTLLHVTNPIGWIGLSAILLLLAGVVLWSIMGSFTVKADGYGLITDAGGVRKVTVINTGQVNRLYINKGARVKKNQQIAQIDQVNMTMDTIAVRNSIDLGANRSDVEQRVNAHDAKRMAEAVNEQIYSPYTGVVTELLADEGTIVRAGDEICAIRLDEDRSDLTGIMYVSVDKGKRLEPGMSIQLAPNGADTSQTGSLLGVVRSVSDYPVDQASMVRNLGNAQLAQTILQQVQNSVVEVRFDLVKNENDASGYLWTSIVGEHKPVTAGTYVTGSVIIDRKAPIEKVFYKASQWLRNR